MSDETTHDETASPDDKKERKVLTPAEAKAKAAGAAKRALRAFLAHAPPEELAPLVSDAVIREHGLTGLVHLRALGRALTSPFGEESTMQATGHRALTSPSSPPLAPVLDDAPAPPPPGE